jgi:quinol monooxygenase YgiN
MSKWLDAAKRVEVVASVKVEPLKRKPVKSVLSVLSEATRPTPIPGCEVPKQEFPYGLSVGGRPKSAHGRVVSLEDWRNMTEWEKHGPKGSRWNGCSYQWDD